MVKRWRKKIQWCRALEEAATQPALERSRIGGGCYAAGPARTRLERGTPAAAGAAPPACTDVWPRPSRVCVRACAVVRARAFAAGRPGRGARIKSSLGRGAMRMRPSGRGMRCPPWLVPDRAAASPLVTRRATSVRTHAATTPPPARMPSSLETRRWRLRADSVRF